MNAILNSMRTNAAISINTKHTTTTTPSSPLKIMDEFNYKKKTAVKVKAVEKNI